MEALIGAAFLVANLVVLGLNIKLYTEILKDKSQDKRVKATQAEREKGGD